MAEYLYGPYGEFADSIILSGEVAETVAVYIGTAPVNLVRGYADKELVDTPIQINNLTEAKNKIGYCGDTESFTLCEAVAAHFDSDSDSVGPIYVINALDPAKHKSEMSTSGQISFVRNKAEIPGTHIILDSLKIARPVTDPAPIGFMPTKEDAEAALSSVGNPVTDCSTNTIYIILDKPLGGTGDYLMLIETAEHTYGLTCLAQDRKPTPFKFYCELNDGKMVDYLDGEKKSDDASAKLDLSSYTGDIKVTLASCNYTDKEHYPTDIVPIESKVVSIDAGQSPQFYEENRDYVISYNSSRGATIIEDITESMSPTCAVTYDTVDDEAVTVDDIVGEKTANGEYSGCAALELVFTRLGKVPNIVAAPGWSHIPEVYKAMCKAAYQTNGHWYEIVYADIPLVDAEMQTVDSMALAIDWKNKNNYDNEFSKVFWPMAIDTRGRLVHLSTLALVEQLRVDQTHNAIPFETCANKEVSVQRQYFGEDSRNRGFDQTDANTVTAEGIATVAPWGTKWVIWGDHTAAYHFGGDDFDERGIFDVTVRMLMYILNSFQLEWAPYIDKPMTRAMKDVILNREQEKLDNLVAIGALLGTPTVQFSPDVTVQDIMYGNFVWDFIATPTVPLKSAKAIIAFTDAGYAALLEGSE